MATRRDGDGNGDHDGDDDGAVVEDVTIGFCFLVVVVPVFQFCIQLSGFSEIVAQFRLISISTY